MPTLPAPGPGKTAGEDSAVEVAAKLTLHIFRHRPLAGDRVVVDNLLKLKPGAAVAATPVTDAGAVAPDAPKAAPATK